jgi:hypothetical protein
VPNVGLLPGGRNERLATQDESPSALCPEERSCVLQRRAIIHVDVSIEHARDSVIRAVERIASHSRRERFVSGQ